MRVGTRLAVALAALVLVIAGAAFAQNGGLTALPPTDATQNLLQDGGFEATGAWRVRPEAAFNIDNGGRSGKALKMANADRDAGVAAADQSVTLEPGFYTIQGWVKTENVGTASPRTGVRLCLDGRPRVNWWKCTEVARETKPWTELSRVAVSVPEAGAYRMTVGAYGKPDGVAWFDDVAVTRVKLPPLDAFLLYPNYRGTLWDDRPQTIRMSLAVASDAPRGTERIRLSVVAEAGGAVRAHRDWPASAARGKRMVGELDAAPLAPGEYLLRAELLDGSGASMFRSPDHRLAKMPAKSRQKLNAWIDETNATHLGGKPAFVLGLYNTSGFSRNRAAYAAGKDGWGNDRIAEAPFNMLINYHLGATPIPALNVYMDDLHARGIYYLQTVNFYHEAHPQYRKLPYDAIRDGEDALNRWVGKTLVKHPGLAGFYTADERTADMVPTVFRQHRELRRAAPGTVDYAVLGNGWQDQAPLWRDAADVVGLDPYPIVKPGENHLAMVGDWTRIGHDAVMGARPLWMVIQYFPVTRQGGWPSRDDLRTMSWMAIVEGAKGLFYWSFGVKGLAWVKDPKEKLERWQDLVAVTKEIKALEPVLLAPDAPVVREAPAPIRVLGKKMPDGTRYLFAYNTTAKETPVRLTLTEAAREVAAIGGGAAGKLDGSTLSDTFGPYQVKRYTIR